MPESELNPVSEREPWIEQTCSHMCNWSVQYIPINMHTVCPLQWRHNGRNGVSNHQPHHCLLNRLFRRRSKKTAKLRVTGLCAGNSPVTGEFSVQMTSRAENISIRWRHHAVLCFVIAWGQSNVRLAFNVASLALGQPYNNVREVTLKNMGN